MDRFSSFSTEMDVNRDTILERRDEEHLSSIFAEHLSKLLPSASTTNEERMMERHAVGNSTRPSHLQHLPSRRGRRRRLRQQSDSGERDAGDDREDDSEECNDDSGHEHGGDVPVENPEVTDRSTGVGLHAVQELPMCAPPPEYELESISQMASDDQFDDARHMEEPGAMTAAGATSDQTTPPPPPPLPQPISLLNFINVWRNDLEQLLEPHEDPETAFCFLCEYGDENDLSGTSNPLITQLKKLFEGQLGVIDLQRRCALVQDFYNRTFKSHCNHRVWHIYTIFRHFTRHTQCTAAQKELQLLAVLSAIERLTQKHIFFNTPEGSEVYSRAALSDLRALIQIFKSLI